MGKTLGEMWRTCNHCAITFDTPEQFSEHWSRCPIRVKHGYINERTERRLKASQLLGGPPTAEELQGEYILPSKQRRDVLRQFEQALIQQHVQSEAIRIDNLMMGVEGEQVPQPTPARVTFITTDDWIAMYVDGVKKAEGHSLRPGEILDALGITHTSRDMTHDTEEFWLDLAHELKNVELYKQVPDEYLRGVD